MKHGIELVGKIGSMALINAEDNDIDYNIFARVSRELVPGYIWVSSGATEIGRLDYIKRTGKELAGRDDTVKTDYAAQGQSILMQTYRRFINPAYNIRQVLVEHQHFNDSEKRKHLRELLLRCPEQNAIPIINYNDAVSFEENRKMEIQALARKKDKRVYECVDNDETAAQIACLVNAKYLLILTGVDGIYADINDSSSLVKEISGKDVEELLQNIDHYKTMCRGSSRKGSNGAGAKLDYIKDAVRCGTIVKIANSKYKISDIMNGKVNCTTIGVR
jgi:glutamate 5-kinase